MTTDSTTSEDDNVPPPLPAKMRESTDYSSLDTALIGHLYDTQHGAPLQLRAPLNRSLSMSVGSGRYTNKPLPAVPQQQQSHNNSSSGNSQSSSSTTITSITSHNAAYDIVETTQQLAELHLNAQSPAPSTEARMRRTPPTPPPKPSRGSKAPPVA